MIKLGLDKIIVKRHDPSLAVQQALSETVAWCLSKTPQIDQLRSWELDPSVILRDPRLEESSVEVRLSRTLLATVHSVQENGLRLGICDGMSLV
jgi:hypothetical protein